MRHLLLIMMLAVGLAACSAGDDAATPSASPAAPPPAAAPTGAETDAGDTGATDAADAGTGDCQAIADAFAQVGTAQADALTGNTASAQAALDAMEAVTAELPADIQDDWGVITTTFSDLLAAGSDPAALAEVGQNFSAGEYTTAVTNVTTYLSTSCTTG